MKKQQGERTLKVRKENEVWQLQQRFGRLVEKLDRLPDANEVRRNALGSAPQGIAEMVF
ncbi:hypothetical protein [Mucilaginibacter sp. UR6-11]|uniref:hypothetical protein n=1 Tax=Mucilaginibacter sp. UR6-11 TaxID=1435644 RepID=UPI001E5913C6|nr:hypothetical protein [Mucilaginibacter sp. UR6-11]MCC8423555.1 hypothetical protein [Mucilaginibacter sp. UR6-11]